MEIRKMSETDKNEVLDMMRVFYRSPAVHTNGSEEIFFADVENCISENPYLEGYVFEEESEILGYAMLAKSFSTEFGKPCIWIEDLYIKEGHRGEGIGGEFLDFVKRQYVNAVIRLEVEVENEHAVHVYSKGGFERLPYVEMIKL